MLLISWPTLTLFHWYASLNRTPDDISDEVYYSAHFTKYAKASWTNDTSIPLAAIHWVSIIKRSHSTILTEINDEYIARDDWKNILLIQDVPQVTNFLGCVYSRFENCIEQRVSMKKVLFNSEERVKFFYFPSQDKTIKK